MNSLGLFLFSAVVTILVTILMFALVWLIVREVDQILAPEIIVNDVEVISKNQGVTASLAPIGMMQIPQTYPYCNVTFCLNGEEITRSVSEKAYEKIKIGDRISVGVHKGRFSTGYYPYC